MGLDSVRGTNVTLAPAHSLGIVTGMRRLLRWIAAPFMAIRDIGRRGARRWAESPAGVQLGLIAGLGFGAAVRSEAGWMALVLLLWSLPGWIDRSVPGGVRRVLRMIRRKPAIGLLPLAVPLELVHLVPQLGQTGGQAAVIGALAGLLLPFVLGIPPDRAGRALSTAVPGQTADGLVPGFVQASKPRLTNVGPAILTLGGAAAAAAGAFLPWAWLDLPGTLRVTADGFYSSDPTTSDGALALGLAIAVAFVATARLGAHGQAGWRRGVAIAGGLCLITVAAWHLGTLADQIADISAPASITIGPGIGVVGFGGAMVLLGGLLPGRPARLATDFLSTASGPFSVPAQRTWGWNRKASGVAPEAVSRVRK